MKRDALALDASLWWPILSRNWHPAIYDRATESTGRAVETEIIRLLRGLTVSGLTALEFPLAGPEPGIPDISQRIETAGEARWLARRTTSGKARRLLGAWADARDVGAREDPRAAFLARIPSIWLEYDLSRRAEPEPLLCARLPPDCGLLPPWVDAAFCDRGGGDGWRETLERCRAQLPAGSRALYLFDLGARRSGLLRLEIYGIPSLGVSDYLARLGLSPPVGLDLAARCLASGERPHLSLDISPCGEISNRLGLEISFRRLPSRDARWRRLFDELVTAGLCRPERIDFFFDWQGQDRPRTAAEKWPAHPDLSSGHLVRVASHVKLVLGDREGPKAKGYLLFQYLSRADRGSASD